MNEFGSWRERAASLGEDARGAAERAVRGTGRGMTELAGRLRGDAGDPRRERAAAALERGGRYLGDTSAAQLRGDLEGTIRRRPLAALLAGVGLGVALGLLGSRRRRRRR